MMKVGELAVLIAGEAAGTLSQSRDGRLEFRYLPVYRSIPLSVNMPISNRAYGDDVARPYFQGLLPDDPEVRRAIGRDAGVSAGDAFGLLGIVGLDCPGAVQVTDPDKVREARSRAERLLPLTEKDIELRLRSERLRRGAPWTVDGEHWSLGGQQAKIALRREGGSWYQCAGAAASTHILKGGVRGLDSQALDEHLCMRLAAACGLPAAKTNLVYFGEEPAIVVERYDRARTPDGAVARLHQEDLCQALAVMPDKKYTQDGGPAARDVVALLKGTGANAEANIRAFYAMLLFNYLAGATDAHAKNFSILLAGSSDPVLAPLYDVASTFPYAEPHETLRTAMSIGGENRIGRLGPGALRRFVEGNALEEGILTLDEATETAVALAETMPPALRGVIEEARGVPGLEAVAEGLERGVEGNCQRLLAKLGTAQTPTGASKEAAGMAAGGGDAAERDERGADVVRRGAGATTTTDAGVDREATRDDVPQDFGPRAQEGQEGGGMGLQGPPRRLAGAAESAARASEGLLGPKAPEGPRSYRP